MAFSYETDSEREAEREKDLVRLQMLRPMDDDFMRCLFRDNRLLVQKVLRIVTGDKKLKVMKSETQRDCKRLAGARSIAMDVYARSRNKVWYDLEVQRDDSGAGSKRVRYHAAVMDIEKLKAGQDFEELPETQTIFITETDFFGKGMGRYYIERMNLETGEPFGDAEHILYINGQYKGDDELGRLMHDFRSHDPDQMKIRKLAERVRYFKESQEGRAYMCRLLEEMKEETAAKVQAREEAKAAAAIAAVKAEAEAKTAKAEKTTKKLEKILCRAVKEQMKSQRVSMQEAMRMLGVPGDMQRKLAAKL